MLAKNAFIVLFLAIQIALPVRYYVVGSDPLDERFAWRMFSPERMVRCQARFEIDRRPARTTEVFHEAWMTMAQRGRRAVTRAMAGKLCADNPGHEVTLTLRCRNVDGTVTELENGLWNMCGGS